MLALDKPLPATMPETERQALIAELNRAGIIWQEKGEPVAAVVAVHSPVSPVVSHEPSNPAPVLPTADILALFELDSDLRHEAAQLWNRFNFHKQFGSSAELAAVQVQIPALREKLQAALAKLRAGSGV
jgi:hypothetical protein